MSYGKARELKERHAAVSQKMAAMVDVLDKEDRGFTEEEKDQWEALAKESNELEERIKAAELVETSQHRFDDADLLENDRQQFEDRKKSSEKTEARPLTRVESSRAFAAWCCPESADDADLANARRLGFRGKELTFKFRRENGIPRTIADIDREYRAQSLTAAAGGYTVPDEMMRAIEVSMLTFGNVRGVSTVISTTTGADLPIPTTNDTGNVGAILAENTQASPQDLTFAQLVLQAYKYSSKLVLVSVELMQDSSVSLPAFLGERLGERIARITNQHFTTGTGSAQPNGIVTAAGNSGLTTASNTAITWTEMMTLKHSVDPAYRVGGAWMMDDAIVKILKTQLDSTNRPLWMDSLVPGAPMTYDGDPIVVNNDMATGSAAKAVIYGNFSKYIVREVAGVTLLRLDERYADYHQVGFLAFARYDGDLLDAGTDPVRYLTLAT